MTIPVVFSALGLRMQRIAIKYIESFEYKTQALVRFFHARMDGLILGWIGLMLLASLPRILFPATPVHGMQDLVEVMLPYGCIAIAPILGYRLAAAGFPHAPLLQRGGSRRFNSGKWRQLDPHDARMQADFGPTGFMASLMVGMLLNVPFRAMEFLLAVPAMNSNAPTWGTTIFHIMAADVCLMSFLYMVCFVLALRTIPLFPRMLAIAWGVDIAMQFVIANAVAASPDLPGDVAMAVNDLLHGNVRKVLISITVWLPYLLLSRRVNLTYRQRVAIA
ncbi:DUF2569 domain-containing protein [Novosphingobium mangrovi (ex Huang et al. 2023)]|uniref:DUF2569 domain-containing protein n=1 Tax=Novosphingobium mangrovi (ex Huang et al. 2023) TaxID=2976432 RepID=A0ABT2I5H8_9SPHN|nr:DUF2569 domain-containing protein [Novosphingobium mangrovi (ex Huang et al. 2023)]MCT2400056.1 DUF2569 domain-containing protein [Novosphingobium mangrovi (ex Huang et al. 2023)]